MPEIQPRPPRVSVIIPAYNQAAFLQHSVESVLAQTYRDYEIIIVDDGSTDNTRQVAADLKTVDLRAAGWDDRIRYIYQENLGLAGARNTAIRAARGELIGLLDSDDAWLPDYLETMVALADSASEAAVFYCRAQSMDVQGVELPQVFGGPARPPEMLYLTLVRANFIIPSTVLFRKSIVQDLGLFDQNLRSCEDWDLWLRVLPTHPILGIDDILVNYRIHGSSLSTNPSGMQRAARAVIEKHFGLDDGIYSSWSETKQIAFGGLYAYHAWTSILRQGDWEAGAQYLLKAVQADPKMAEDVDFFYELGLGQQPFGFRGTARNIDFQKNARSIQTILASVANQNLLDPSLVSLLKSTAFYALGLLAYHIENLADCRRYLWRALRHRPGLVRDRRLMQTLLRALFPKSLLNFLRTVRRRTQQTS